MNEAPAINAIRDSHPLADPYHEGYKVQMDFYAYLLPKMDFDVSETAYSLGCKGYRGAEGFLEK